MNHKQAIELVNSLMPEIRSGGDAEAVLLKHAKANNMPPAQLEKLGHVFNTMRTVNFIDKAAAACGDTFEILDVPHLTSAYQEHRSPSAKSALFRPEPSFEVPDIMGDIVPRAPMRKAAQTLEEDLPAYPPSRHTQRRSLYAGQWEDETISEQTKLAHSIAEEASGTMQEVFTKIARYIREARQPEVFGEIEHDMGVLLRDQPGVKLACDSLVNFCPKMVIKRAADIVDNSLVVSDRHRMQPYFTEVLEQQRICKNAALFVGSLQKSGSPAMEAAIAEDRAVRAKSRSNAGAGPVGGGGPKSQRGAPRSNAGAGSEPETSSDAELIKLLQQVRGNADKPSDGGSGQSNEKSLMDLATGGVGSLDTWKNELLGQVGGPGGFNDRQQARDNAAGEVRQVTNFERLLATDPVLMQSNPVELTSFYNSLRKQSPTVASDINQLRMILRQATQYQGLTPDVMKTLVDTELNVGKGINQRQINEASQYAIGAPALPSRRSPKA